MRVKVHTKVFGGLCLGLITLLLLDLDPRPVRATEIPAAGTIADRLMRTGQGRIASEPGDVSGHMILARGFLRKARESGAMGYYLRADAAARRALLIRPDHYDALRLIVAVKAARHEFRDVIETAGKLLERRPHDFRVLGLLGDAYLELGEYQRAVQAYQRMMDLRPGLGAYSRAARIRLLYGDNDGAMGMLAMALRAASPRDPEPLAWALVEFGKLQFGRGALNLAEAAYQRALEVLPDYFPVPPALARVHAARGRHQEAIALLKQSIETVPTISAAAFLGELLEKAGRAGEAERYYILAERIGQLNAGTPGNANRELARFYADHDRKLGTALELVAATRRQDIDTYDTLAWVYYKAGKLPEASKAIQKALRLGTQDASLFFHAGMIAHGAGNREEARLYLERALHTNPYFSILGARVARNTLARIPNEVTGVHLPESPESIALGSSRVRGETGHVR